MGPIFGKKRSVEGGLSSRARAERSTLELTAGSRIAVVGGGPSGSLFTYFVHKMAALVGLDLAIDIFEPRRFDRCGPAGCNHCGGIVSESLVQLLAAEGINLPPSVVRRGIDSYVLHMDVGSVRIDTPLREKRIAAVFRGNGPRDVAIESDSFDRFLLNLAVERGARVVPRAVTGIEWPGGRPRIVHADGPGEAYDLVAVAVGVNSNFTGILEASAAGYRPPKTVATYICEFELDRDTVQRCLGTSMHVFLLDIPRLEFAALIPKGNVVTMCLLGDDIDATLVRAFLDSPEVRGCFPSSAALPETVCNCSPRINVAAATRPYADRMVVIGDCGVTRLYKDGIGAAYRTAKGAAVTAVFQGISAASFRRHFGPVCRRITVDNAIGRLIFAVNRRMRRRRWTRAAIHRMVSEEQASDVAAGHLSGVLWDLFTGSAPYREVLRNTMHPGFVGGLLRHVVRSVVPSEPARGLEGDLDGRKRAG